MQGLGTVPCAMSDPSECVELLLAFQSMDKKLYSIVTCRGLDWALER